MNHCKRYCVILAIFAVSCGQTFALESVKVSVKSKEKDVAAIGFSVDNKESGGLGSSYTGRGPKNHEFFFGYQRSIFGDRVRCGSLILTQDTTVYLVNQGDKCISVLG